MRTGLRTGRRQAGGFSLLEILIVLVVLGVIAAITVPSMINALNRAKQRRVMADLRLIGGGVEAYMIDHERPPQSTSIASLSATIAPEYIPVGVTSDGWDHAYVYAASTTSYTVGSTGTDGGSSLALSGAGGPTHGFDDDIIYTQGRFRQWPEGTQQ